MEGKYRKPVNCKYKNCYYYEEEEKIVHGAKIVNSYCKYPYDDFDCSDVLNDCPHYKPDITKLYKISKRNK